MSYITGAITDYQGGAGGLYPNVPASGVIAVQGTAGQITAVTTAGTAVVGLADAGAGAATYGGPVDLPVITVDAKGRTTAVTTVPPQITAQASGIAFTDTASNVDIVGAGSITVTAVSLPTDKVRYTITDGGVPGGVTQVSELDGSVVCTPNPIVAAGSVKLSDTGVGAGFYGNATNVARIQLDAQGRALTASNVPITFPAPTFTVARNGGASIGNATGIDVYSGLDVTLTGTIAELRLLPVIYSQCCYTNALVWATGVNCNFVSTIANVTAISPSSVAGSECHVTFDFSFIIDGLSALGANNWGFFVNLFLLWSELNAFYAPAKFGWVTPTGTKGVTPFCTYGAVGLPYPGSAQANVCNYFIGAGAPGIVYFNALVPGGNKVTTDNGINGAPGYSVTLSVSTLTTW